MSLPGLPKARLSAAGAGGAAEAAPEHSEKRARLSECALVLLRDSGARRLGGRDNERESRRQCRRQKGGGGDERRRQRGGAAAAPKP